MLALRLLLLLSVITPAALLLTALSPAASLAQSSLSLNIPVEVELDLCPERLLIETEVLIRYRLGESPDFQAAEILESVITDESNSGTFRVEVPGFLLETPIHLAAFCRNGFGEGPPSAEVTFSNCDSLALEDTDFDGLDNASEDTNCDNFFSPGDFSNPDNVDTDGDGVRDLVELVSATDPSNPGSSPRPKIFTSAPFDPDQDGNSNPVVFRPGSGEWFVRDFAGSNLSFQFGLAGDIPFTYSPGPGVGENAGVIIQVGTDYQWFFRGTGFGPSGQESLVFGIFGDNVLPGPWETAGTTSPAVARLFNNNWEFNFLLSSGEVRRINFGGNGDVPMVSDYDGDGLFDVAVFRPSEQQLFVLRSTDGEAETINFGSGTAEFIFRGDIDGNGSDDVTFWEPTGGIYSTLFRNSSEPTQDVQLGLFFEHLPLPWNNQGEVTLYTVVDHQRGLRFFRNGNNPGSPIQSIQWGLSGDSQG